ncbi:A24 family peptidase [Thalassobacillus hwangdonensis]|uniref:Prepilin peptidase n=1 Tax=Thalassobacillus hwangdonensis TaxID=546108 RepID=A0ABW3L6G4_9BACI
MDQLVIVTLFIFLSICVFTDVRERKIYNSITLPAMVAGIFLHTLFTGLNGMVFSLAGLLLGFFLLFIPFLFGGMGAGDVKMLAGIGALTGASFVLTAFFYGAIIGGVMALSMLLRKKHMLHLSVLPNILKAEHGSMRIDGKSPLSIPYGVALAGGTVCAYVMEVLL